MRILLYDIEVSPLVGPAWATYETNLIWIIKEWYIISFAYKWLDEKRTHVLALPDYKLYAKQPENDRELVRELHKLFDEADVIIAHNGDRFDAKKVNARIVAQGLTPPSPYKSIDTLKVARSKFAFTSNKLDSLGKHLGCGQKLDTGGYELWQKCMAGDSKAWNKMKKYNKQDVVLLEQVYRKLLPWMSNHPSLPDNEGCPKCGSENLQRRGFAANATTKYQRYQCQDCGGWCKFRIAEKTTKPTYVN